MKNAWMHCVFFLFIIGLLLLPSQMIAFSNSIMGKLFFILFIVFYSTIDHLYGLLICLLLVLYYQEVSTGSAEEGFDTHSPKYQYKSEVYRPNMVNVGATPILSEDYVDPSELVSLTEDQTDFQEKYCHLGKLQYKGYDISKENAEYIFPELQFSDSGACDPCDIFCKYSIQERIHQEITLAPKSSKDWMGRIQDGFEQSSQNVSNFVVSDLFEPIYGVFNPFGNKYTS